MNIDFCLLQIPQHVITSHHSLSPQTSLHLCNIQVSKEFETAQCKWFRRTILTQALCCQELSVSTEESLAGQEGTSFITCMQNANSRIPDRDLYIATFKYQADSQQILSNSFCFLLHLQLYQKTVELLVIETKDKYCKIQMLELFPFNC